MSAVRIVVRKWLPEERQWMLENYSALGKSAAMKALNRSEASIRKAASSMGLRIDLSTARAQTFLSSGGVTRRGRKRPAQADVMKCLHAAGKMRKTPEQLAAHGKRQREMLQTKGHPKGFLGGKHSAEAKAKISQGVASKWQDPSYRLNSEEHRQSMSDRMAGMGRTTENTYSRCKRGRREDLGGMFFRSKWEANYGRYLNWMMARGEIASWSYESKTFWFEKIRRGVRSYTPDFEVIDHIGAQPRYVEVKGWMDPKSATKIARMARYHPKVKLEVFGADSYKTLIRLGRTLSGWEI